ncbi:MAG: dihydroneopterin aldolase [Methylacidiphilales bacterium]|nr:dihydroneopterin aldolase [Candidatus Methylacidiphilales bacterium]MDW8348662.1 dihydroneopterin aldolase [Verrucomicrobiae bacterium]
MGRGWDIITLRGIKVPVYLGVPDEERARAQTVHITAQLYVASDTIKAAAQSDCIEMTLDYAGVYECILRTAQRLPYRLMERLAEEIVGELFVSYPVLSAVRLEICKFILPQVREVSLEIFRER